MTPSCINAGAALLLVHETTGGTCSSTEAEVGDSDTLQDVHIRPSYISLVMLLMVLIVERKRCVCMCGCCTHMAINRSMCSVIACA